MPPPRLRVRTTLSRPGPQQRPLRTLCCHRHQLRSSPTKLLQNRRCKSSAAASGSSSSSSSTGASDSENDAPSSSSSSSTRAAARDDFYALLLSQPLSAPTRTTGPTILKFSPSTNSEPSPPKRAAIVFGSRLAGPAARASSREEAQRRGEGVWAGPPHNRIWIPPKPTEPDNCCMSGCVNCVWDGYREDLEVWAGARREARRREVEAQAHKRGMEERMKEGREISGSIDDDGGGSEALWMSGSGSGSGLKENAGEDDGVLLDEALLEGIPVGIREFMRTEKRLGERKRKNMAKKEGLAVAAGAMDKSSGAGKDTERLNAL